MVFWISICARAHFKLAGTNAAEAAFTWKLLLAHNNSTIIFTAITLSDTERGSMLIALLFAPRTYSKSVWSLCTFTVCFLTLTWPFASDLIFFWSPCRPLSYSDAAMRWRSRPLQSGGAAAHPQTAGWRQWRGNRGQWECGGELCECMILGIMAWGSVTKHMGSKWYLMQNVGSLGLSSGFQPGGQTSWRAPKVNMRWSSDD